MTSLLDRPTTSSPRSFLNEYCVNPVAVITAQPDKYSLLQVALAYAALGQRPIPLCDAAHAFVSVQHRNGYQHKDGTVVAPCQSRGKALLEPGYPHFARMVPTDRDLMRMFTTYQGNMGNDVAKGHIVIDVDPRSAGLESLAALTGRYGPFSETPTVRTGGNSWLMA